MLFYRGWRRMAQVEYQVGGATQGRIRVGGGALSAQSRFTFTQAAIIYSSKSCGFQFFSLLKEYVTCKYSDDRDALEHIPKSWQSQLQIPHTETVRRCSPKIQFSLSKCRVESLTKTILPPSRLSIALRMILESTIPRPRTWSSQRSLVETRAR